MSKLIIVTLILSASIIVGVLILSNNTSNKNSDSIQSRSLGSSVTNDGDKQIIEITAKGGYSPTLVQASADKSTILRVKTKNTFDCSAALAIPSLGIRKMLPSTGTTDIEIGSKKSGTQIDGTCSMGMYNFSIKFN